MTQTMTPGERREIDGAFDVALDAAEIRLTCGHCRREPATHVLVAWCGAPVQKRICEVVCGTCGDYSLSLGSDFLGCVQMYPVQLVEAQTEVGTDA